MEIMVILLIFAAAYYFYRKHSSANNTNGAKLPSHDINHKKQAVSNYENNKHPLDVEALYQKLVTILINDGYNTSEKMVDDKGRIEFRVTYEGNKYCVMLVNPRNVTIFLPHFVELSRLTDSDDDICRATIQSNSKNKCAKIIRTSHNDKATLSSACEFILPNYSIDSRIISRYFDACKSAIAFHAKSF